MDDFRFDIGCSSTITRSDGTTHPTNTTILTTTATTYISNHFTLAETFL